MDLTIILLLVAAGAFIIPALGGDDDDDSSGKNEVDGTFGDDDPLDGTDGNDFIRGFTGNDVMNGFGGNDDMRGGDGEDEINGGGGLDYIRGGADNDTIDGGEGDDRIFGDRGNDTIDGGFGSDRILGGQGDDTIFGGFDSRLQGDGSVVANVSATDSINGEQGEDTIYVWGGESVVNGGQDGDELILMTGEATFIDEGGEDDFYALGNLTDDQETLMVIREFDVGQDDLTLTVDSSGLESGDSVVWDLVFTETTIDGEAGLLITVNADDEGDADGAEFESASAFLVGLDDEDIEDEDIAVIFTDEADLFDAEGTLADVKSGGLNILQD